MPENSSSCSNDDCQFSSDGKCVEGYALDNCPHLSSFADESLGYIEEWGSEEDNVSVEALPLGEALTREQATLVQRRRVSRVVGIIGPNEAGKTSLLASVYGLLQEGPIEKVGFAGSSTLIGFEKICHDARAESRRGTPHTQRTIAGAEATFFHLDLRIPDGNLFSLLIGDRSGEDYLAAGDDLSRADEFFELRRADVVTLLVNGEHLASSQFRHEVKATTPNIVEALVEAQALRRGCRLAIVLTKHDSILASPHADRVYREFDSMADTIEHHHSDYLGEVERFIVAASPKDSSLVNRGEGVKQLLLCWLRTSTPVPCFGSPTTSSSRMIDLLDRNDQGDE